jgi:hydroxymethylbilane synthase
LKALRIATRKSALALWQAEHVAARLRSLHADLPIELVPMTTRGDDIVDRPLAALGGKGLFLKELETAMLEDRADIAVHSFKDVPMELDAEFAIGAVLERADAADAFISNAFARLDELPRGSRVGTSSLRRQAQLRALRPDLESLDLRGNVNTRLAKLDAGDYDAIILAAAGLRRLGLDGRIGALLPESVSLPGICQGILGIEYPRDRADLAGVFAAFEHPATAAAARAERAFGLVVEGSCEVPVGALAQVRDGEVHLSGFVGVPDGSRLVRLHAQGAVGEAEAVGRMLGDRILAAGGREILDLLAEKTA